MTASTIFGRRPVRLGPRWGLGLAAIAFGVMTLLSGGKVLFGGAAARAQAGHVVDFVLIFNFSAGFMYLATGIAALLGRRWAVPLASALAAMTLLVFAAFGVHVALDGAFETQTVAAMTVRLVFWTGQAVALAYIFNNQARGLPKAR